MRFAYRAHRRLKGQSRAEQLYLERRSELQGLWKNRRTEFSPPARCYNTVTVANHDSTVLFLGETGTERSLSLARFMSAAAKANVCQANCARFRAVCLDIEFFGPNGVPLRAHSHRRLACLELADQVTLFWISRDISAGSCSHSSCAFCMMESSSRLGSTRTTERRNVRL